MLTDVYVWAFTSVACMWCSFAFQDGHGYLIRAGVGWSQLLSTAHVKNDPQACCCQMVCLKTDPPATPRAAGRTRNTTLPQRETLGWDILRS